jgi:hypothetical protein
MSDCGETPRGRRWPARDLPAGHPGETHESNGLWWSDRQQAPVMQGHFHSTELFCTSACPGYRTGTGQNARPAAL